VDLGLAVVRSQVKFLALPETGVVELSVWAVVLLAALLKVTRSLNNRNGSFEANRLLIGA
jgi:hypothetical protein